MNTAAEFLQASPRNRDFRRRPARVFRGNYSATISKSRALPLNRRLSRPAVTLRRQRSPSKSGMCPRPTPTPMIRRWPPMARSGTPDRNRIRWGRPDPVTAWWLIAQATSGLRQTSKATSGSSIREQAKSPNTPCLTRGADDAHTPVFEQEGPFSTPTPIPSGGGVVRNIVATPDRKLYLACSSVSKIGIAEILH